MNYSIKVGDTVKVKPSATRYSTGQTIPAWVKGRKYTVQQVKADRVLLKEIISWVFIRDVEVVRPSAGGSNTVASKPTTSTSSSKGAIQNGVLSVPDVFGVKVKVNMVKPKGKRNVRTLTPLKAPFDIVVHNTANTAPTADAENHAKYLQNLEVNDSQYVSWHFTVDENSIVQHLPLNERGYHAGDGGGRGNANGIGIEICENGNYKKAEENAIKLIIFLQKHLAIPNSRVNPHRKYSPVKKLCPRRILRSQATWVQDWANFLARIDKARSSLRG